MKPNYAYIHEACGKPAFYMEDKPRAGQMASAKGIHHPDGTPAVNGTPIACGSCGKPISNLSTNAVREVDPQLRPAIARVRILAPQQDDTTQELEAK